MPSRSGLLLLTVVLVACGAVVWLLAGENLGDEGDAIDRPEGAHSGAGDLLDPDGVGLQGRSNARTAEEIEAERAARDAAAALPTFPRSEGVFGRITDASDQPVAGATVKLLKGSFAYRSWGVPDPAPLETTETDADGRFLVGPAPPGRLRVRAEADGYAPSLQDVKRRGYRIDIILDRGGALDVTVKDGEGEPLPGARVLHQAGAVVTDATTDEEGNALFPGLPTGTGQLFVSAEGHAGIQQSDIGIVPGGHEHRTVVLGKPLVIDGRVLDQETERPIEGARMTLRFPGMPWIEELGSIASDADGRFETAVPLPVGQSMDIGVEADGYATSRAWYQATDAGDGRMSLELKLVGGSGKIRGEVLDDRGNPQTGVKVTYMTGRYDQEAPETTTAADGSFVLPPTPWSTRPGSQVQVVAIAEGGGVGVAYARLPKAEERATPITIRLSGTGSVRGRVLDPAGEPIPGALVNLVVDWTETMKRAQRRPGQAQVWQVLRIAQDPRYSRLDVVTNDEGRFVLEAVPLGAYRVSASFGLHSVTAEDLVVVEGGAAVSQDIELGEGTSIEGYVLDGEGAAVPGARVTAYPEQQRGPMGQSSRLSARSQSDGRFVLHNAATGIYTLRAWAGGYESKSLRGISAGQSGITLTMVPLGWIDGVVQHLGRPYQGTFTVTAKPVREGATNPRMESSRLVPGGGNRNTFHTDDGRFTLRNLKAGKYDIAAQTPDGLIVAQVPRVDVADGRGTRATVELVGGAVLQGTVVDDATGEALVGAQVSVRGAPGADGPATSAHTRTDAQGKFVARGLSSALYVVYVYPPSGIPFHQSIEVQAGETRTLNLRERQSGAIQFSVRDSAGRPVESATPRVKSEAGPEVWPSWQALRREGVSMRGQGWSSMIRTDASGANLRRHVPPGRYLVSADKQGMKTVEPKWIDVGSGRTAQVEVILEAVGNAAPNR